jgi:hypothetical protein
MRTRVVHVDDNVPGAVYIARAAPERGYRESPWRNPFRVGEDGDRAEVNRQYAELIRSSLETEPYWREQLSQLVGRPLACWCRHDGEPRTADTTCHGDILFDLITEFGLDENSADT